MIKSIVQSGRYLTVTGNGAYPYISSYGNGMGTGNMRFNTQTQNIEVYDGNQWITCSTGSMSVGLNGDAESLLDWARIKRDEESRIVVLAAKHPTVANALEAVKKAQEQLQLTTILCETNER
jgi:hypothetical protein